MNRDTAETEVQEQSSVSEPWPLLVNSILLTEAERLEGTVYEVLAREKVREFEIEIKNVSQEISSLKLNLGTESKERDRLRLDVENAKFIDCQRRCDDLAFHISRLEKKGFALQQEMLKHVIASFQFLHGFAKTCPSYVKLLSSDKAQEQQNELEKLSRTLVPLQQKLGMKLKDLDTLRKLMKSGQNVSNENLFASERECNNLTSEQKQMQERLIVVQHEMLAHRVACLLKTLRNTTLSPRNQSINVSSDDKFSRSQRISHGNHASIPNGREPVERQSISFVENTSSTSETNSDDFIEIDGRKVMKKAGQTQNQNKILSELLQTVNTSIRGIIVQFNTEIRPGYDESPQLDPELDNGPATVLKNVEYLKRALIDLRVEQSRTSENIENIIDCLEPSLETSKLTRKPDLNSRLTYLKACIQAFAPPQTNISSTRRDAIKEGVRQLMQKKSTQITPTNEGSELFDKDGDVDRDVTGEDADKDMFIEEIDEESNQDTSSDRHENFNNQVMSDVESASDDDMEQTIWLEEKQILDRLEELEDEREALMQDNSLTKSLLAKEEKNAGKEFEELQKRLQDPQKVISNDLLRQIIDIKSQCEEVRSEIPEESVKRLGRMIQNLLDVIA